MPIQSVNPANRSLQESYEPYPDEKIEAMLSQSVRTGKAWRSTSIDERSVLMEACANVLTIQKKELAVMITLEMGKPLLEARREIEECVEICNYFAEFSASFLSKKRLPIEDDCFITYEPLGNILCFTDWQYPFAYTFRMAVPALMVGNTVFNFHANNTPQCALAIREVFRKAGFPDGVYQAVLQEKEDVPSWVQHEKVHAVSHSGNYQMGSLLAREAGAGIKKAILDVGGITSFLVLSDARVEEAAGLAARSCILNTGQSPLATKRIVIVKEHVKPFISIFKEELAVLKLGDPMDKGTDYGPLASPSLANSLSSNIQSCIQDGARLVSGGQLDSSLGEGSFFQATVLRNIEPDMLQPGLMGPIAGIIEARDTKDAIKKINSSGINYGVSLWTKSKAKKKSRRLDAGVVWVNQAPTSHPAVPIQGNTQAGYSHFLSGFGLREFAHTKTLWKK